MHLPKHRPKKPIYVDRKMKCLQSRDYFFFISCFSFGVDYYEIMNTLLACIRIFELLSRHYLHMCVYTRSLARLLFDRFWFRMKKKTLFKLNFSDAKFAMQGEKHTNKQIRETKTSKMNVIVGECNRQHMNSRYQSNAVMRVWTHTQYWFNTISFWFNCSRWCTFSELIEWKIHFLQNQKRSLVCVCAQVSGRP